MDISHRLDRLEQTLNNIERILEKMSSPASTLSVNEKAAAIKKALATGNKDILKQTMKEINGE